MSKYKCLLFDLDNTLLDFSAAQENALQLTFGKYGIELTEDIRNTYNEINHGLWEKYELGLMTREQVIYSRFVLLFEKLNIEADGIAFEEDYQEALGKGDKLMPYAREVLEALKKTHKLYVVTNGVTDTQFSRLKLSDTEKYFEEVFVSEAANCQKPSKEFFQYCFEKMGNSNVEEMLIIGDSLSSDIKGGNNANIDTCWYNPKGLVNSNIAKADMEIKDLRELLSIV